MQVFVGLRQAKSRYSNDRIESISLYLFFTIYKQVGCLPLCLSNV